MRPSANTVPDRWELGTLPFESLAGVRAAADYLLSADWEPVERHEQALLATALDALGAMPHVTLHGAARDRAPTLMFSVAGRTPEQVAAALAAQQIAVWHGNYYAWELERHLGLEPHGAIRAGFVHYNDEADAERLLAAVADLVLEEPPDRPAKERGDPAGVAAYGSGSVSSSESSVSCRSRLGTSTS